MDIYIWDDNTEGQLTDLLFESNFSRREIAAELGCTELEVTKRIRELGLGWVRRKRGDLSRGQAALTAIMRKLLPGEKIVTEESLPGRLRLDVYCPKYKLAAEYHGRQHFQYVEHFHGDLEGLRESQRRDVRKLQVCEELGIALVVFRYYDRLDEEVVYERLLDALRSGPVIKRIEKKSLKDDPHYEAWMQRQREYRRQQYRRLKQKRGLQ